MAASSHPPAPIPVAHVDGDKFQVVGEKTLYDDPIEALQRMRKKGPGSRTIRLSDGKEIASVPGYIPPAPKDR